MEAPTPISKINSFEISQKYGEVDDSMIEYAKMTILYATNEFPNNDGYIDDYKKANFVREKFNEKYRNYWSCCFSKSSQISSTYFNHWICLKYKDYVITIWKSSN